MNETTYLTPEGLKELQAELNRLIREERPRVAARIGEAKSLGDISENADYEDAKNEQAFLEGRIATIEAQLSNYELIESNGGKTVNLGSTVTFEGDGEKHTFTIVGAPEANPREGRISHKSPVAAALMGHKAGDSVDVTTPDGQVSYKIRKVA